MDEGPVVLFPPFVMNERDRLYVFHDAAVHRACLDAHPLGMDAWLASRDALRQRTRSGRACAACGKDGGGAAFMTGLLTSDRNDPAYAFNFIAIHTSHFADWERSEEFRASVGALVHSDRWQGPKLVFDPVPRWAVEPRGKLLALVRTEKNGDE